MTTTLCLDEFDDDVVSVLIKYADRYSKKERKKFNKEGLTVGEWIDCVQEEIMDSVLYLERVKQEIGDDGYNRMIKSIHQNKNQTCTTLNLISYLTGISFGVVMWCFLTPWMLNLVIRLVKISPF